MEVLFFRGIICVDGGANWDKFREFAKEYGHKTQAEMAELWEGEISKRTISRALKKIGFTQEKRPMATGSGMK